MPSPPGTPPLALAPKIASCHIPPPQGPTPTSLAIELSQARHRIRLLHAWGSHGIGSIPPGSRVLELGCGQGTCTAVLAEAVGDAGHVDAVDPASPDYGAPATLGQAQAHLSEGPVGGRITFHRADPVAFLLEADGRQRWDVAVLAHCVWYFRSAGEVKAVLAALRERVDRVVIAEYALRATESGAVPHVLAAVARGTLEAHRGEESGANIRTLLSPGAVRDLAEGAGWAVAGEGTVVPEPELSDGGWEVGNVVGEGFVGEVEKGVGDERVRTVLRSARDAVVAAVEGVGGVGKVRTMDVWVATLVAAGEEQT